MNRAKKAKKSPAKKTVAKKTAAKKTTAKKTTAKKTAAKKTAVKRSADGMVQRRADYGAPVEGFFAKQPPALRPILDALRALVHEAVPDATASMKWGMPCFTIGREMVCALAGFKSHVNLILRGPPGAFADPDQRLEGEGKTGRHLKLRSLDELPRDAVRGWVRAAAQVARST